MPQKTMRTVLLLGVLLATSALAQGEPRRVAVLPLQALSGDVPPRAGPRVTARLTSELRTQGLTLVEPPATSAPSDALARARALVKEAQAQREARDFARADATLAQALEAYAAGASGLSDGSEPADAYALRAAVRYAMGQDSQAEQLLIQALALSPARPLPLAATSPLFARTVERVRGTLGKSPRGAVTFLSVPPGVTVTLDGHTLGVAPVRVAEVPPGVHLWRATLPSGEAVGGLVEVDGRRGNEAEVRVHPAGDGPGAALALTLANNRLDAAALEAAGALGGAAGADLVVLGAVSRAEAGLALDTFVLAPGKRTLRRLPRVTVDAELLDAGAPLQQLATLLASRGAEAGEPASLPVMPTPLALPRLTQAVYPAQAGADAVKPTEAVKPAAAPVDRQPLSPRKPLTRP
jgi:hypothetical protein